MTKLPKSWSVLLNTVGFSVMFPVAIGNAVNEKVYGAVVGGMSAGFFLYGMIIQFLLVAAVLRDEGP
jgi:hypothetical protein